MDADAELEDDEDDEEEDPAEETEDTDGLTIGSTGEDTSPRTREAREPPRERVKRGTKDSATRMKNTRSARPCAPGGSGCPNT